MVADVDCVVEDLVAHGVVLERYESPELAADDRGVHTLADGRVAWFRDPDGNMFSVEDPGPAH